MHWCLKLFLLSGVNRLKTSFGWTKLNLKKKKFRKGYKQTEQQNALIVTC